MPIDNMRESGSRTRKVSASDFR